MLVGDGPLEPLPGGDGGLSLTDLMALAKQAPSGSLGSTALPALPAGDAPGTLLFQRALSCAVATQPPEYWRIVGRTSARKPIKKAA